MSGFEDGLWARLVDECNADDVLLEAAPKARRTRGPLLLGGGVTAAAAVAAAAVIGFGATGGATPAYAMTQNADGTVTVTINDIAAAVPALNAKFKQMGVDATVVPVQAGCSTVNDFLFADPNERASDTVTIGTKNVDPGYEGVIAAEQLPDGEVALAMGAIKPPVPSCYSTEAFTTRQIGDANGVPTITEIPVTPSTPASPGS